MKIKKFKIENYVERLYCDCGMELIYHFDFTNSIDSHTKNVEKKYKCSNCGKEILENKIYPNNVVEYVEVE